MLFQNGNSTRLYINFEDNQPVPIETHFTPDADERKRPFTSIGHLIASFKVAVAQLLDNGSIASLARHELEPDMQLSEVTSGTKAKNLLIIEAAESSSSSNLSPNERELLTQVNNTVGTWNHLECDQAFGDLIDMPSTFCIFWSDSAGIVLTDLTNSETEVTLVN